MQVCRSLDARKIRLNRRHLAIGRIFTLHGADQPCITARKADDNVDHHFGRPFVRSSLLLVFINKERHFSTIIVHSKCLAQICGRMNHYFLYDVADTKSDSASTNSYVSLL